MYAINVNISCSALNELENRIPMLVSVQMNGEVECKKKVLKLIFFLTCVKL